MDHQDIVSALVPIVIEQSNRGERSFDIYSGMRVALTNARIMIHQPSGGAQGMASDIEIQAKEILRIRHRMNELYAQYTGKTLETIEKAMDRDKFLSAQEAQEFGIVDEVFDKRPAVGEGDGAQQANAA